MGVRPHDESFVLKLYRMSQTTTITGHSVSSGRLRGGNTKPNVSPHMRTLTTPSTTPPAAGATADNNGWKSNDDDDDFERLVRTTGSRSPRGRPSGGMKRVMFLTTLGVVVFLNFHALWSKHYRDDRPLSPKEEDSLLFSEFFSSQPTKTTLAEHEAEPATAGEVLTASDVTFLPLQNQQQEHAQQQQPQLQQAQQQQQAERALFDVAKTGTMVKGIIANINNKVDPVTSPQTAQQQQGLSVNQVKPKPSNKVRRAKVLMGIMSSELPNDRVYRRRHRKLFKIWNDKRTCSLPDFIESFQQKKKGGAATTTKNTIYDDCELIYTFVAGANTDPNGPTELVRYNASFPLLVTKPIKTRQQDLNEPDTTLLNIRENMNEGKSQTFFYFASLEMEKYGIDYVMKCDGDALLHLHEYFSFANRNLPPAPYNTNIYAGALRDKANWLPHEPKDKARFESHFGNEYDGVHVYIAGQNYILSRDLAKFVAQEAVNSRGYVEGHEDHDISTMAFHSPLPVHLVAVAKSQRFWEHPVKGEKRWQRMWEREQARMSGRPFEGKTLKKN